ncbi:MAG: hypothetical protein HUU41_03475 [Bryobacteraceae bacterium]|nr:hypothetical protein [Bryobacterales bacterium]MEB2359844.1 hypothetical protein [Bryobacterales bacterium]NUN00152.1 hypothetical protein [Bryobacteraceae bacterium]
MRFFFWTLLLVFPLYGQRTLVYDRSVVSQVRIDLRELGYPPEDVIPSGESAIRSLAVAPNGAIYGATSGKRSHLFALFPQHGYVQPLGFLKDVSLVHRALVVSKSGDVYIGAGSSNGHLFKYVPKRDEAKAIRIDVPLEVTDLGIPVAGEGIYSLAIDRERDVLYGLTWPSGQVFSYRIGGVEFAAHGKVAERNIPGENFEKYKNIGRAITVHSSGFALMSGENGRIFRVMALGKGVLEPLDINAPTVRGREPYNGVDAWAESESGILYGGTSDGYLFRLDPKSWKMENLGKPLNQYRIRGLAFAKNGKLYGVGGDDDEMARLFSYDPASGVYEMLGMIDVNRRPYYSWQAYVIDAVAAGLDGTLYFGQSERKSKLYLYYP